MVTSSRNSSQNCQFFLVIVISHGCSPSFTNSRSVVKTMICLPVTLASHCAKAAAISKPVNSMRILDGSSGRSRNVGAYDGRDLIQAWCRCFTCRHRFFPASPQQFLFASSSLPAAVTEIETRLRKRERGLIMSLDILDKVLEFGSRFPADGKWRGRCGVAALRIGFSLSA
jgi:hypothetical protein